MVSTVILAAIIAGGGAVLLLISALLGEPAASRADPRPALLMFGLFLLSGGGFMLALVLRNRINGHADFDIHEWFRRSY